MTHHLKSTFSATLSLLCALVLGSAWLAPVASAQTPTATATATATGLAACPANLAISVAPPILNNAYQSTHWIAAGTAADPSTSNRNSIRYAVASWNPFLSAAQRHFIRIKTLDHFLEALLLDAHVDDPVLRHQ